jgi:hypothetical protein
MFALIAFLVVNGITALAYYTLALLSAMHSKRWAIVGLVFGMLALPLFVIHRHMQWRRTVGFNNDYLAA